MPQVRIIAKNLFDMVAALPAVKLDKLYKSSFICEAILRSLPSLAKKYVLQMLCVEVAVNVKSMYECVFPDGVSKHRVAIDRLVQLRIFNETKKKGEVNYTLNHTFQTNLKELLLHGYDLNATIRPSL